MTLQNTGGPAGIDQPTPVAPPRHHKIRRTRVGGVWVALAVSAVVLVLLLIFILENLKRADISLFGAHVSLPIGVALLLAAAAGALIVIIPGTVRIVQLRMTARWHRRVDEQEAGAAPSAVSTQPVGGAPVPGTADPGAAGAARSRWAGEPSSDPEARSDPKPAN